MSRVLPQRWYRIRDLLSSKRLLRKAEGFPGREEIAEVDMDFAGAITAEVQAAAESYFVTHIPYLGCPEIEGISTEEVLRRVRILDEGMNTKESRRAITAGIGSTIGPYVGMKYRYPLQEMSLDYQRALIEQIERLKRQRGFRKVRIKAPGRYEQRYGRKLEVKVVPPTHAASDYNQDEWMDYYGR